MNRRSFLQTLIAALAAWMGVSLYPPAAKAAPTPIARTLRRHRRHRRRHKKKKKKKNTKKK
jgi:hypothetical protein